MRKRKLLLLTCIVFLTIGFLFWYQGLIIPNQANVKQYPIKGVDVSAYQGVIEWSTLEEQGMSFAFIKATEGSSFVDRFFESNWENAQETNIRIGAYHFFSYDSGGNTQAENFINTVPIIDAGLPPVIDVEFYADKAKNPPPPEQVETELNKMIQMLEAHYGKRVIIYTTNKAYELYIKDGFENCDIWIRDVFTKPSLPDGRSWTFWQYTDRERLEGYQGEEKFIDVNVFHGDMEEFQEYGN